MAVTHTYTYAILGVPQEVYDLIRRKLDEAGYQHAFHGEGDRAANEAAVLVLARALDVPPAAVRISAGRTQRNKTVEIALPLDVLRPRIAALLSAREGFSRSL